MTSLNLRPEDSDTGEKRKFSMKNLLSKCDQICSLVTFTEEILNGKLHFACTA